MARLKEELVAIHMKIRLSESNCLKRLSIDTGYSMTEIIRKYVQYLMAHHNSLRSKEILSGITRHEDYNLDQPASHIVAARLKAREKQKHLRELSSRRDEVPHVDTRKQFATETQNDKAAPYRGVYQP